MSAFDVTSYLLDIAAQAKTSPENAQIHLVLTAFDDNDTLEATASVGESVSTPHNEDMAMTREELEAHLKAQAAETKAAIAEQNRAIDARLVDFGSRVDRAIEQLKEDRIAMREDARSTRNTVVGSALAILLALFGSVYAINSMNSSIVGNVISAWESGRNVGAAQAPTAPASAPK